MGLLEKALSYKNRLGSRGKKTIMDRITGPAETGSSGPDSRDGSGAKQAPESDILYLQREDLTAVEDDVPEEAGRAEPDQEADAEDGESRHDTDRQAGRKSKFSYDGPARKAVESDGAEQGGHAWDNEVLLDNIVLYELSKDLLRASTMDELFDVILFSVMGQIGVSSSSIMIPSSENPDEWEIVESRGVTINPDEVDFRPTAGILKQMITRKEIIDVEEFKDNTAFSDDYYTYISIDARLVVPVIYNQDVLAAIILGNKLTSEDYTGEEKGFFNVIAEYSAFSFRAIRFKEMNETGSGPGSHIVAVDRIRGRIAAEHFIGKIRDIIREEFRGLGIVSFAIFIKDQGSRDYVLYAAEPEDRLKLGELGLRISSNASLIFEISHAESPVLFNDYQRSKTLVAIFTDKQLKSASMMELFTFKLGGELLGFVMIFDLAASAHLETVHTRLIKFTDYIFPYIAIIRDIEYRQGSYIDTIERIFSRVDDEIKNARNLNIPVTLVLLSIKNYKRFNTLFGHEKAKSMFTYFEKFIKNRLSDRDFSVRYDRHKILLVLPGKDKKYAVPLANTICNEMTSAFSTRDAQLLITFLTAEFPIDGSDTYSLVDAVN